MSVRLNDMTDETIIRSIGIDNNSMEKTLHGSSDFPVAVYNTTLSNFHLRCVDWHWHKELQFCYVTSGKVDFSVGAEHHVLNEGEGIFINSGHIHTARPADSPDDSFVCLDFDPKLLSVFAGSVFESNYVRPYIGSSAFSAQELRTDILHYYDATKMAHSPVNVEIITDDFHLNAGSMDYDLSTDGYDFGGRVRVKL